MEKIKRNASVELARVIACMIVIGCHVYLEATDAGRIYIAMCFADGVAVFWLITGFFFFNNDDYKTLWVRTLKKIIMPSLAASVATFYFYYWINGNCTFVQNITRPLADYTNALKKLLLFNTIDGIGQLWYVFIYILVVLIFPFLKGGVDFLSQSKKRQYIFVIITSIIILINDFLNNELMGFSHHTISGLVPASIMIIDGWIMYGRIKTSRNLAIVSMVVFALVMGIRTYLSLLGFTQMLYWCCFGGLIASICVVLFSFSAVNRISSEKMNNAIRWLGGKTFTIYLVHMFVVAFLNNKGYANYMQSHICTKIIGFKGEMLYTLVMLLTVFVISLVVASIISAGKRIICLLMKS